MRRPLPPRRAHLVLANDKVRCRNHLLKDVFVIVVMATASNVLADYDDLRNVVRIPTARFDRISEEAVDGDVFEAMEVLTEFCKYDGSSEALNEGDVDTCLVMESRGEELLLDELKQKKEGDKCCMAEGGRAQGS